VSNLDFFKPLTEATEVADATEGLALEDVPLLFVPLLIPLLFTLLLALLLTLLLFRLPDELVKLLAGEADRLPLPLGL
jgi:hypothetical protein